MAAAIFRVWLVVSVFVILVAANGIVGDNVQTTLERNVSRRSPLDGHRENQILSCNEHIFKSRCLQNSECRWCQSEALDDMCFSVSEARRLPTQISSSRYFKLVADQWIVSLTKD